MINPKMKDFVFVSGNMGKVRMLEAFLGRRVEHHAVDLPEIQSLDSVEVAKHKAKEAYKILKKPVLVDDVSLKINALGGLPGALVKFFLKAIGTEGICRLISSYDDKSATANTIFVLYNGKKHIVFNGEINGSISPEPRGDETKFEGMGWNPIFIPSGQSKTVAELGEDQLSEFTPRGKAVKNLKKFLEQ